MHWIASAWDRMGWTSAIFVQPKENPSTVTRNNLKEGVLMHKKVRNTVLWMKYYRELGQNSMQKIKSREAGSMPMPPDCYLIKDVI